MKEDSKSLISKYSEMWAAFQSGQLSESEWVAYTLDVLYTLLEENRDVFMRLKDR